FYHKFVAERGGDLERLLDHFLHVLEVGGTDCVGLGSDFDGLPAGTAPLVPDASQLPLLTEGLLRRGVDEETVRKILGGNFERVFTEVLAGP
ncbi:MAG: membrane dipeptidase, partial [Armatimonadetes bacterium]|nr:membrane dipeptidase [Armatimonadota bacterium]